MYYGKNRRNDFLWPETSPEMESWNEIYMDSWYETGDELYKEWVKADPTLSNKTFSHEEAMQKLYNEGDQTSFAGLSQEEYEFLFEQHLNSLSGTMGEEISSNWEQFLSGYGAKPRYKSGEGGEESLLISPYQLRGQIAKENWDNDLIQLFYEKFTDAPMYQNIPSVEEEIFEGLKTLDEVPIQGDK